MISELLESNISLLYTNVGTVTLYRKENGTPEYFYKICRLVNKFEQDLVYLRLQGGDITPDAVSKLSHLKTLACG